MSHNSVYNISDEKYMKHTMKLFWIVLLLCGVTFCLEQANCSDQALLQCLDSAGEDKNFIDPETEEDLEKYCRMVECIMAYYDKCETKENKHMSDQHQIIYGSLCFKKNALRGKYLENAKCLNKAIKAIGEKCTLDKRNMDHDTFCKKLPEALKCGVNYINHTCSEDAAEVYQRVYPGEWFYNCHQEDQDIRSKCSTEPKCTKQDLMQCLNSMGEEKIVRDPETDEDLEKYCRAVECILECYGNCRDDEDELMYNQHEIIYGSLCFKKNGLRRKYLENAQCLNRAMESVGDKCSINTAGMNFDTFCEKLPEVLNCSRNYISETCNEDSADVYRRIYPGYEFFGCGRDSH